MTIPNLLRPTINTGISKDRGVPVMDNFPLAILEDPSGDRITTDQVIECLIHIWIY